MTTVASTSSLSADDTASADVQLVGQPALRGVAAKADLSQVDTLWNLMLLMMNTLNQPEALDYFAIRYFGDPIKKRIGAAIAAPQINYPVQAFLMYDHTISTYIFFINPEYEFYSEQTWNSIAEEGCLSIPFLGQLEWGKADTKRKKEFTVAYYTFCDRNGKPIRLDNTTHSRPAGTIIGPAKYAKSYTPLSSLASNTFSPDREQKEKDNMLNWIVQHEIDHLYGVLYTDYLNLGKDYKNPPAENNATRILYVAQQNPCVDHPEYPVAINSSLVNKNVQDLTPEQAELLYVPST